MGGGEEKGSPWWGGLLGKVSELYFLECITSVCCQGHGAESDLTTMEDE
jgi:hypothetical protein